MKLKYLIPILLFVVVKDVTAQTPNAQDFIPPAPTASGLGKYADIPVSLYTGVPNINIPLYEVRSRGFTLPISLSYHSAGIKVEEIASWVGMGWSLNAGGVIARTAIGGADFGVDALVNNLWDNPITSSDEWLIKELAEGNKDGEHDVFYFNFAGYSGKFIFDNSGDIQIISKQKLQISTYTSGGNLVFEIIAEDGMKYLFEEIEENLTGSFSQLLPVEVFTSTVASPHKHHSFLGAPTIKPPFISSWYLTQIVDPNDHDIMQFTYVAEEKIYRNNFSYTFGYKLFISSGSSSNVLGQNVQSIVDGKRLSRIDWPGGKVEFFAEHTREDINCNFTSTDPPKALTGIKVFDIDNNIIKVFALDLSYFEATGCNTFPTEHKCLCKRLKLDAVTELDVNEDKSKPSHQFIYDNTLLPPRFSWQQDYWGFYNANTNARSLAPQVYAYPGETITSTSTYQSIFSIYQRQSYTGNEVTISGEDRSPNPSVIQAAILKQIIYPTGGSTEFDYEPHEFRFDGQNHTGGGLRIKSITHSDGVNTLNKIIKNYSYTLGSNPSFSSGSVIYLPQFASEQAGFSTVNNLFTVTYSSSQGGLGITNGSHIGYTEVIEEQIGNGKTVFIYNVPASFGVVNSHFDDNTNEYVYVRTQVGLLNETASNNINNKDYFPFPPNPNFDWNRGQLLERTDYNNQGNMVRKVVNEYEIKEHKKIKAIKAKIYARHLRFDAVVEFAYKYGKYYMLSGWKVLKKQTETIFDLYNPNSSVDVVTEYFYDNPDHLQLTRIKNTNSENTEVTTKFKYAADYAQTTSSNQFVRFMNEKHIHDKPVETTYLQQKQGQNLEVVGAIFQTYQNVSNGLQPHQVWNLETNQPLSNFSESFQQISSPFLLLKDSRYTLSATIQGLLKSTMDQQNPCSSYYP